MSYDDMPQKQARIEALREEKGRLQKVRQTIAFYEANAASGKVKKAVLPQMAQQIQQTRYRQEAFHFNAQLPASLLERYCSLTREGEAKMQDVYVRKQLTARSYHRMLKVARTIADLEGCRQIQERHLDEAILYRASDGMM